MKRIFWEITQYRNNEYRNIYRNNGYRNYRNLETVEEIVKEVESNKTMRLENKTKQWQKKY